MSVTMCLNNFLRFHYSTKYTKLQKFIHHKILLYYIPTLEHRIIVRVFINTIKLEVALKFPSIHETYT